MTWRSCFMGCSIRAFTTSSSRLSAASRRLCWAGSSGMSILPSSRDTPLPGSRRRVRRGWRSRCIRRNSDVCGIEERIPARFKAVLFAFDGRDLGLDCDNFSLHRGLFRVQRLELLDGRLLAFDQRVELVEEDSTPDEHACRPDDELPVMAKPGERELDRAVLLHHRFPLSGKAGLGHGTFASAAHVALVPTGSGVPFTT